jgi:hypothetical protein
MPRSSTLSDALEGAMPSTATHRSNIADATSFFAYFSIRELDVAMVGLTALWCVMVLAERLLHI